MKKIIVLLGLVVIFHSISFSQILPNAGFENWTGFGLYEMPDSWKTTDSISTGQGLQHSASKELTDIHGGSFALKLNPFTYFSFAIPGAASNGAINASTYQVIGGSPDTVRHATLDGWYKFSPTGGDSVIVSIAMYKWNGTSRDLVGAGEFKDTTSTTAYTSFSVNINYYSPAVPDSMLIILYAGSRVLATSHIGTTLLIDDLSFSGVVGTHEIYNIVNAIRVFPIPAINELNVQVDLKHNIHSSFEILDVSGKRILVHDMKSTDEKIDISGLTNGNYFYHLLDELGTKLSIGKFTVNK